MNDKLDSYLFDAFANAADNTYIYVADLEKHITRWSPQAVEYFNFEGEYIENATEKWLSYVHPDDVERYVENLQAVLSGKLDKHNCQYRARNRYGNYIWIECRGSVLKDENGKPHFFAGMMTRLDFQQKYDNLTKLKTLNILQSRDFNSEDSTLMLIGVDKFRKINTRKGMVYGNKLLVYLAQLLQQYAPEGCEVYRFNGDEFMIHGPTTLEEMKKCFRQISNICGESNMEAEIKAFSVSAGAVSIKKGNNNFIDIITKAVNAISFAKETPTHFSYYSSEVEAIQNRKNLIAEATTESIRNGFKGFHLYFQPIMTNDGKQVYGCESLLRWKTDNEEIGQCSPSEFIPILESNGCIIQTGYFVMHEAIRQASEWQKQGAKFHVSFNVSYLQLEDPNFIPDLLETANYYQTDNSRIIIELTESVHVADTVLIKEAFDLLHKNGFRIALDDFGTGYSSFWMLHNLEVDILKLDQTFIRGLGDCSSSIDYGIVKSVACLCNSSNYTTIVEGVENETVLNIIQEYNFQGLQGYRFSKPISKTDFEEYVKSVSK